MTKTMRSLLIIALLATPLVAQDRYSQRERFGYFRTRCFSEGLSKAQVTRSVGVADGLSAERRYARVTLRRGATRGLRDAVRGDLAGLARSGAIASGLLFTTAGFALGTLAGAVTRVTR